MAEGDLENMNGRLRRDWKVDLDKLFDDDLQDIVWMHNLTPGKCLGFQMQLQVSLNHMDTNVQPSRSETVLHFRTEYAATLVTQDQFVSLC